MKQKVFTLSGKVVDKNGEEHIVTLVGKLINTREKVEVSKDVTTTNFKGNQVKGMLSFNEKVLVKSFTMACSICCPTDNFDEKVGVELATKRLKTKPIGTVTTTDFSMLNDDMCNILLLNELNHISKNFDKVIARY